MADILRTRIYVTYWQDYEIDLDEWEEYGYDSREHMISAHVDEDPSIDCDYWDISNDFDGAPIITREILDGA